MKGMMTVTFSSPMIVPGNYTKYNSNFLQIKVIPGERLRPGENKTLTAWQIVDFTAS
jgi:hypothetical protein